MTYHIFLQARQNSTRLPNKILKQICNKTIFELIIERLKKIKNSEIYLITGESKINQELISKSKELNIKYFSGNENNVLDRFFNASKKFNSEKIIRITGDCPLIDYTLINETINKINLEKYDLICNYYPRTFPHGYDFEIIKSTILEQSWILKKNNYNSEADFLDAKISPLEHIISSKKFLIKNIKNKNNLSHYRLTLDYFEDYELIKIIYHNLYKNEKVFDATKTQSFLEKKQDLLNINRRYNQILK